MSPRLDGVDVSHHQYDAGPIDWDRVAAATNGWAATKLTQSVRYLDPTSTLSRSEMRRVGITQRLVYHWLSSTTDPAAQAAWFLRCYGTGDEGAMCDAEEPGVTVAKVVAWCEAVEAVTRRPCVVYSGAFVDGGRIWQSINVRNSIYGERPMILAAYTTETKARALPGVAANPWHAWQFSSSGPVPGVTGRCDMNRVDGRAAFDLACGLTHTEPPEVITPLPPPSIEVQSMILVRNAEAHEFTDGQTYPANTIVWEMVHGARRHVTAVEFAALNTIPIVGSYTNAQLGEIPQYVAPGSFIGSISLSGGVSGTIR